MSVIYLASLSPRRRELLEQLGVDYALLTVGVDEACRPGEAAEAYVRRLAEAKAVAGRERVAGDDRPVLGADTAVVIDGEILGKPANRDDGLRMLERLSGRRHRVYTAVALAGAERLSTRLSVSTVTFRSTTPAERAAYWATGEPADKAGAYGIQGRGALFVERLEGSYSGVMGLPLFETGELLRQTGIDLIQCWGATENKGAV